MNKIISIIIPTYNMDKYLYSCLSSLLIAEYMDVIEVIVVNDGSTDASLPIAEKFRDEHPDSFVLIDKPNGNYGSCVNAGLEVATGKYVKILDADDTFDTANFEYMVYVLGQIDVDLIITRLTKTYPDGSEKQKPIRLPANNILKFTDICHRRDVAGLWMHEVAYRRSMLQNAGYRQTEGISFTDQEWVSVPMMHVHTAYFIDRPVYRYLLGREGQTMDSKVYRKTFAQNIICTCNILTEQAAVGNVEPEVRRMLNAKMLGRIRLIYKNCLVRYRDIDENELLRLDATPREKNNAVYAMSNNTLLSRPLFCLPYIRIWRRNRHSRFLMFVIHAYLYTKRL